MLAFGLLWLWSSYAVGSYGWNLIKGYDIPFRAWVSPLHPYTYPAGGPAQAPDTEVFPSGANSATAASGTSGGTGTGQTPGPPIPGGQIQQPFGVR